MMYILSLIGDRIFVQDNYVVMMKMIIIILLFVIHLRTYR